jgi:hypothetical protein
VGRATIGDHAVPNVESHGRRYHDPDRARCMVLMMSLAIFSVSSIQLLVVLFCSAFGKISAKT